MAKQLPVVVVVVILSSVLSSHAQGASVTPLNPETVAEKWNMLFALDELIARQEDVKDVRCWSSVTKLQMYLAGAQIDSHAIVTRIEQHKQLIDSIWREGKQRDGHRIEASRVTTILDRRFPRDSDADMNVHFYLRQPPHEILVDQDAIRDYGDTVEPARLLQSFALNFIDEQGQFEPSAQFSEDALNVLQDFLRVYDIAVLRYARHLASIHKKAVIDGHTMGEAFGLEKLLRRGDD